MILFPLVLAVLLHEIGHITAARLCGVPLVSLGWKGVGLSMQFDFSHVGYLKEALIHSGGAVFGVASAVVAVLLGERYYTFAGISLILAAVNLYPLPVTDGGAIIRTVLSAFFLPDTAEKVTKAVFTLSLLALWSAVLWCELRVVPNLGLLLFVCILTVYSLCTG